MQYRLKQTFSLDFVISIEYLASVVIEVSSNLSIGPSPRITISFFILSACSGKLLSTQKQEQVQPNHLLVTKIVSMHQIQYHNHCINIYQHQHFQFNSWLQTSNHLVKTLHLNLLTLDLLYRHVSLNSTSIYET